MKFSISYQDSGSKRKSEAEIADVISALESTLGHYLKNNPHFHGVKMVSMTMSLCGRAKIKSLNRQYRQIDKVTDVLSFPVYENLRPDKKARGKSLDQMELGDLIICREKALSQSREFGITYEQEIIHLVVHGFLHLLGFDHELSVKEEKIMEKEESVLVEKIYKKLKYKARAL